MPRISKVRIVNFSFNDGNRMIADELFDFKGADDREGQNVLINLANGGGKSVLVQLMMQPVIPKAKVAGRRIESHFTRPRDHCFVLLEWIKDNSKEKLLTGIAMAAMERAGAEQEEERGMAVKYYTFCSDYLSDDFPYSIAELPLSAKENGKFIPADYLSVRKLEKKSGGRLICYQSDESALWRKKLDEYGLVQSEWHMIEKLNAQEGGFGEYFGSFKTSNALMDELLIPTIEQKISPGTKKEKDSLSTMFLDYVKQYEAHRSTLQRKQVFEAFRKELELFLPLAETLWKEHEEVRKNSRALFGLSDALKRGEAEQEKIRESLTQRLNASGEQERRIHWEQCSARYYQAMEKDEQTGTLLRQAEEKAEGENSRLEAANYQLRVQECAYYGEKLSRAQSKRDAVRNEITHREHGSDAARQLRDLRYSAACAIRQEQERQGPEYAQRQEQRTALEERLRAQKDELGLAERTFDRVRGSLSDVSRKAAERAGGDGPAGGEPGSGAVPATG